MNHLLKNQKKKLEKKIRLAKIISHFGFCSRRDAEQIIINGGVTLKNSIFKEFTIKESLIKYIKVNGVHLKKNKPRVWCFYKPRGYVCSNSEQFQQKSFFRILPNDIPRVVSVGRLDILSEGLLLLTNNPSLSNFLEKPINSFERNYIVKVFGLIDDELPLLVKDGIKIKNINYKGLDIKILTKKKNNNYLKISIYEGKNREIRKVLEHFKLHVKTLKRISYGPFFLNELNNSEIKEVDEETLKNNLEKIKFNDESDCWKI